MFLNSNEEDILKAADIIKSGGLVGFPTETVYGIGADAFNEEAVKNIFKAKGRPIDNPLIVHISDFKMIDRLVTYVPDNAKILMDAFMPGPITLIMKKSKEVNDTVTGGLDTVAIRFPAHPAARKLIEFAQTPIPAPSANLSGKPSPTTAKHVADDMTGRIDAIIDGGECSEGLESTVVDCTGEIPVILRPGIITLEDIQEYIPEAEIDENILKSAEPGEKPRCPGMKYKHYAPDAEVIVVEGEKSLVAEKIKELIKENNGRKIGVMACSDTEYKADLTVRIKNGNKGYAHSLFSGLRNFDEAGIDIVFAEFFINDKYAITVKNRLYKSASNNIIYV